jgi:hypothetical protein
MFLNQGRDEKAMYFAACSGGVTEEADELLRVVAQQGYAPAQARMAEWGDGANRFEWAQKAAAQG